jgi:hypothetical protein
MDMSTTLSLPEMTLPQHNLTRYIRVGLSVVDGVMVWRLRRLVLGVIPLGWTEITVPVGEVTSLRLQDWTFRPLRILAALAVVVAAAVLTPWYVTVPVIIVGLWIGFVGIGPSLQATTDDGAEHRVAVCFGHRFDAELFIEAIRRD